MKGLRIILWICGIMLVLNSVTMLIPWRVIASWGEVFGLEVPIAPFPAYVTRLCQACFGLVGVFLVILATDPLRYGPMLPLAGYGAIFLGLIILIWGLRYKLSAIVIYGDMISCIVAGALILTFRGRAIAEQKARQEQ